MASGALVKDHEGFAVILPSDWDLNEGTMLDRLIKGVSVV